MTTTKSWRLKLDRAEKHLDELEAEVCRYSSLDPHTAVKRRQPKGQKHLWTYVVQFTLEPHDQIGLAAGDAAHNMRTALDHLAVAMSIKAERNSAYFPIEDRRIWEVGPDGNFLIPDDDARQRFDRAVRGMTGEAIALVKELQPYNFRGQIAANALRVVRVVDDADKHRQIIRLRPGLQKTTTVLSFGSETVYSHGDGFRDDGAEVGQFNLSAFDPKLWPKIEPQVNVEIRGSLHVAMEIADVQGFIDTSELRRCLAYLRDSVCPELEGHVRR